MWLAWLATGQETGGTARVMSGLFSTGNNLLARIARIHCTGNRGSELQDMAPARALGS